MNRGCDDDFNSLNVLNPAAAVPQLTARARHSPQLLVVIKLRKQNYVSIFSGTTGALCIIFILIIQLFTLVFRIVSILTCRFLHLFLSSRILLYRQPQACTSPSHNNFIIFVSHILFLKYDLPLHIDYAFFTIFHEAIPQIDLVLQLVHQFITQLEFHAAFLSIRRKQRSE